jgi:hypothetical protein
VVLLAEGDRAVVSSRVRDRFQLVASTGVHCGQSRHGRFCAVAERPAPQRQVSATGPNAGIALTGRVARVSA